jgi:hypothetical protein
VSEGLDSGLSPQFTVRAPSASRRAAQRPVTRPRATYWDAPARGPQGALGGAVDAPAAGTLDVRAARGISLSAVSPAIDDGAAAFQPGRAPLCAAARAPGRRHRVSGPPAARSSPTRIRPTDGVHSGRSRYRARERPEASGPAPSSPRERRARSAGQTTDAACNRRLLEPGDGQRRTRTAGSQGITRQMGLRTRGWGVSRCPR